METVEVTELDGSACADALTCSQAALVDAERLQVELVAQWCDVHGGHAGPVLPGRERSVVIGGDGTPSVREFAAAELGVLLGMTSVGAHGFMRDVLGLRHRHPRLFALVRSGDARFFQARQVARVTLAAELDLAQARQVDERVAPYLGQVPWGRIMSLVDAAVIEADPEAAEQRRITAEMQRFVRTGRSSEFGTTMIYARARAGDAIFFLAMCDRIAQILKLRGSLEVAGHADHDTDGLDAAREMDVLRSEAVGILACPVKALALLRWAEDHAARSSRSEADPSVGADVDVAADDTTAAGGGAVDASGVVDPTDVTYVTDVADLTDLTDLTDVTDVTDLTDLADLTDFVEVDLSEVAEEPEFEPEEPEEPEGPEEPEDVSSDAGPAIVLDGSLDVAAFSSRAVLYVHVSQESFHGQTRGVARVEGVGPVTLEQAMDFLRHCNVTVRPVIDLNADPSADGYEVSPLVRETMILRDPVEPFPWGTQPSRSTDADHRTPYRAPAAEPPADEPPGDHGPPGHDPPPQPQTQTHADNMQPLGRLHHRLKTHGGWSCTSPERGVQLWRTPHGHWARVDSAGTTYIGRLEGPPW